MFHPRPAVHARPLPDGQACLVIDGVLARPEAWVAQAEAHRARFEELPGNAYPGPELRLPADVTAPLEQYFAAHARSALGLRRTLEAYSRLSLATWPVERLQPRQWICHRDRLARDPAHGVAASVLYLFEDASLGGTAFYRPRVDDPTIARLVHDSGALSPEAFQARYGIAPGYLAGSNAWFECVEVVEPRFNRLILYRGEVFHSAHITRPEALLDDPRRGRLTLNGFFTCTRRLG